MTAERYRLMSGTITDRDLARRLVDYADELSAKARRMDDDVAAMTAKAMDRA